MVATGVGFAMWLDVRSVDVRSVCESFDDGQDECWKLVEIVLYRRVEG